MDFITAYFSRPSSETNTQRGLFSSVDLAKFVMTWNQSRHGPFNQILSDSTLDGPDYTAPNSDVTIRAGTEYSPYLTGFFDLNK